MLNQTTTEYRLEKVLADYRMYHRLKANNFVKCARTRIFRLDILLCIHVFLRNLLWVSIGDHS
jgi:hypothetical protein